MDLNLIDKYSINNTFIKNFNVFDDLIYTYTESN